MNKRNFSSLFDPGDVVFSASGVLYLHRDVYIQERGSKISHIRHIVEKIDGGGVLTMDAAGFRCLSRFSEFSAAPAMGNMKRIKQ